MKRPFLKSNLQPNTLMIYDKYRQNLNNKLNEKYNLELSEYCKKSVQQSINNMVEKYNLEKNKKLIKKYINNNSDDDNNPLSNYNIYGFLFFLSISTFGYLYYNRIK